MSSAFTLTPEKRCTRCHLRKFLSDFNKNANCSDGKRCECRQCQSINKHKYLHKKKSEMNSSAYEAKRRDLNSALKKVFNATPVTEAWLATSIASEMRRSGTGSGDLRAAMGCLDRLVDMGLVKETTKGYFKQVEVKDRSIGIDPVAVNPVTFPNQSTQETTMPAPLLSIKTISIPAAVSTGPIDKLSKLANRLRDLANDMDTAAIELAEQAERGEAETAKMRQLQAILKSLGMGA